MGAQVRMHARHLTPDCSSRPSAASARPELNEIAAASKSRKRRPEPVLSPFLREGVRGWVDCRGDQVVRRRPEQYGIAAATKSSDDARSNTGLRQRPELNAKRKRTQVRKIPLSSGQDRGNQICLGRPKPVPASLLREGLRGRATGLGAQVRMHARHLTPDCSGDQVRLGRPELNAKPNHRNPPLATSVGAGPALR